ncbi:MAG: ribosome biogenesis GTP-binding protein YihA/YsxC [Opitutales bacterium]
MKITSATFATSATNLRACPAPRLPEFAFIGRSNVGKSSLINLLTMRKDLARVSETPGKTQLINFFTINGAWHLVDLPGYGYARVAKEKRADFNVAVADYLEEREALVHTYVLIDSRLPPQEIDQEFIKWLIGAAVEFSLVFTKTDKQSVSQSEASIQRFCRTVLAGVTPPPATFAASSVTRAGRGQILAHIAGLLAG